MNHHMGGGKGGVGVLDIDLPIFSPEQALKPGFGTEQAKSQQTCTTWALARSPRRTGAHPDPLAGDPAKPGCGRLFGSYGITGPCAPDQSSLPPGADPRTNLGAGESGSLRREWAGRCSTMACPHQHAWGQPGRPPPP